MGMIFGANFHRAAVTVFAPVLIEIQVQVAVQAMLKLIWQD